MDYSLRIELSPVAEGQALNPLDRELTRLLIEQTIGKLNGVVIGSVRAKIILEEKAGG